MAEREGKVGKGGEAKGWLYLKETAQTQWWRLHARDIRDNAENSDRARTIQAGKRWVQKVRTVLTGSSRVEKVRDEE